MANTGPYNQPPQYGGYPNIPPAGYPYPPQTGYPHPPPHHQVGFQQPVIVMQPQIQQQFTGPLVGPDPIQMECRSCNARIITTIRYEPNNDTRLYALCLCICLCWPCVCLPYCMDSCQGANHYCPNCNAFIGTHKM